MTREEIMTMVPGKQLDAEIAKNIFDGYDEIDGEVLRKDKFSGELLPWKMPRYSIDVSAAFEVVEKMRDHNRYAMIINLPESGGFTCEFLRQFCKERKLENIAIGNISEAICKAALMALI